jgi:hypothetical protein
MLKKVVASIAATLALTSGVALAASTSLGGRTITPQPAERIQASVPLSWHAYGRVFIQGNSGQQNVRMRFIRNGSPISWERSFTIPAGSTSYYVGDVTPCVSTLVSATWVIQTRFASQGTWTSAPGRNLYC